MKNGRLIGVGVGPGAPDLVTLRAARAISSATCIAYPALPGTPSLARSIVSDLIPEAAEEVVIEVPMSTDRAPAQAAYDGAATRLSEVLSAGQDVAVLCEGDPYFYGSFMYIGARLSSRFEVEVVPGVTSVTACAAVAGRPLVARNERLTILPGPLSDDILRDRIAGAEALAIMKVGRHLGRIRAVLDDLGLTDGATYIERASLPDQRVMPLSEAPDKAPYFSMILMTKGSDPWL